MAWTTINATQTDADSPVNQTLMDAIRTNLDDLNTRVVGVSTEMFVKGWICYDSTTGTPTIKDSYNVSSLTDNGAGDITINWNTDFANANYAVVIADNTYNGQREVNSKTAGTTRIMTFDGGTTKTDRSDVNVAAIGDQ